MNSVKLTLIFFSVNQVNGATFICCVISRQSNDPTQMNVGQNHDSITFRINEISSAFYLSVAHNFHVNASL